MPQPAPNVRGRGMGQVKSVAARFTAFAAFTAFATAPVITFRAGALGTNLFSDIRARRLINDAHGKLHLAAFIKANDLDLHRVAVLDDIGGLVHAVIGQFRDVNQTILGAKEVHEGAEISGLHDFAVIDRAKFRFRHNAADPINGALRGFNTGGGHLDGAVIFNIHLGAGLFRDFTNDLAARADHIADLVLRHIDHGDARRGGRHISARTGQPLGHFAKDVQPAFTRLFHRNAHDFRRDGGDLDVHLK